MAFLFGFGRSPSAAGKLMALAAYSDDSTAEESWLLNEIPAFLHDCSPSEQEGYGDRLMEIDRKLIPSSGFLCQGSPEPISDYCYRRSAKETQ